MLGENKVLYSAMQSTGTLTLGNYMGALDNWVKLADEYQTFYAIADLHSLTVRQDPADIRKISCSLSNISWILTYIHLQFVRIQLILEREQEIFIFSMLQQVLIQKKTVFIISHM